MDNGAKGEAIDEGFFRRYRDLLDAETAVQDALRKGTAWRQLTMVDGLVVERAR